MNGESSHSNETNGNSICQRGIGGKNAMNVNAPMVISGAVSPMARDMRDDHARRDAAERVRQQVMANRLATSSRPSAYAASRICDGIVRKRFARGDDDDRQDQARRASIRRPEMLRPSPRQ